MSSCPLTREPPCWVTLTTSGSPLTFSAGTALACGRCTRRRPSSLNRLDRMKNTTSSSTTSISDTTLISGSSWRRGLRFTACPLGGGRRRGPFAQPRRFQRVRHADRVLLHLHHDAIDPAAQVTIEDEGGNGDAQAGDGADQRLGDAARECARVAHAARLDGVEGADDAGHGAEQAQERRHAGDRAERVDEALELVHHVAPGVLEPLHQELAWAVPVGESGGQESAEGRVLLERRDHLVIDLVRLDQLPHALRQLLRQHPLVLQGPQALQNDGGRGDRAQNDRPHQRTAGPHYFPHPTRPLGLKTAKAASYRRGAAAQGSAAAAACGTSPW